MFHRVDGNGSFRKVDIRSGMEKRVGNSREWMMKNGVSCRSDGSSVGVELNHRPRAGRSYPIRPPPRNLSTAEPGIKEFKVSILNGTWSMISLGNGGVLGIPSLPYQDSQEMNLEAVRHAVVGCRWGRSLESHEL
uniref:Uncharacterized protein n=1 Tax=Compsopogon caeruleus TaxID=31354 RepID=A0A7S1THJ3_9RHOD|mmetsp:Transcript_4375/g.8616  ORF Transcript_4375/g.8616 Transcript_4375/m.8616 type:complete len:135 (+) Transcript_4375:209-613(+)